MSLWRLFYILRCNFCGSLGEQSRLLDVFRDVGREKLKPCISIDKSAELTGFLLHYVKSSVPEDPSPYLGANTISLFTWL